MPKSALSTNKVLLVPYEARHVEKYHKWMQDPDIQAATASEPLTIQEEYENQIEWRQANDKLTFILCSPLLSPPIDNSKTAEIIPGHHDSEEHMIGDVNFFLHQDDDDEDEEKKVKTEDKPTEHVVNYFTGEVDIMVAEKSYRGKGIGRASVCALMRYVCRNIHSILTAESGDTNIDAHAVGRKALRDFMVKINQDNTGSRALFTGLGFRQRGVVNYFGEVEMFIGLDDVKKEKWWGGEDGGVELVYKE